MGTDSKRIEKNWITKGYKKGINRIEKGKKKNVHPFFYPFPILLRSHPFPILSRFLAHRICFTIFYIWNLGMYCEPRSVVRFRSLSQYPDFLRSLISTLCFNIRSRLTYTTFSYERMGGGRGREEIEKKMERAYQREKKGTVTKDRFCPGFRDS